MTQELRKLAERLSPDRTTVLRIDAEQAGEAILALLDRLEKAEKDAERYRWLRDSEWEMFEDHWLCERHIYGEGPDELNAAIDAAMEASK